MDEEEEKPFDVVIIVMLLIIAIANDIAEVFFDLLDFTGVGIAGEAIMEPANLLLDFFFTGVFVWKVGWGGGTVTQYIGDILEPFLIPGRTLSVIAGIWVANHPDSIVGKVATDAAALEGGKMAHPESEGWVDHGGGVYSRQTGSTRTYGELRSEGESDQIREGKPAWAEQQNAEPGANKPENDAQGKKNEELERQMESPEQQNPMERLQSDLVEPQKDTEVPAPENVVSIDEGRDKLPSQNKPKESNKTPAPKIINIDDYRSGDQSEEEAA